MAAQEYYNPTSATPHGLHELPSSPGPSNGPPPPPYQAFNSSQPSTPQSTYQSPVHPHDPKGQYPPNSYNAPQQHYPPAPTSHPQPNGGPPSWGSRDGYYGNAPPQQQAPYPPYFAPPPQQMYNQRTSSQPAPYPPQQHYGPPPPSGQLGDRPYPPRPHTPNYAPSTSPQLYTEQGVRPSRSHSRDRPHKQHHHHGRRSSDASSAKTRGTVDTFLGAGGGAIVGDMIFPGLGTVGGALLGGYGGHKYAKKGDEKRRSRSRGRYSERDY